MFMCVMLCVLKGHPYSYKVAFSLLIAVYSLRVKVNNVNALQKKTQQQNKYSVYLTCCCVCNMLTRSVSNEIFWNAIFKIEMHVYSGLHKKKCFLNQTCNSRQRYEVSQCFIQSLYWCGIHVKYMYHAASNSGGWAGVPIKNFVFAPPSFLVSLPYANTGIRSKNVKHE